MTVKQAIEKRRSYRFLEYVNIDDMIITELGKAAQLAPSCYNNQPWRFIFVKNKEVLARLFDALSSANSWAKNASLVIVVFSRKEDDCIIKERKYYLFDCGLAVGSIILQATELGLVAHPIAGFSPQKVKQIMNIPDYFSVITLIIAGKKDDINIQNINKQQIDSEEKRPERRLLSSIYSVDRFDEKLVK